MTAPATITIEIDGIEYNDIVPQKYRFNPEIEDMIYGDDLKNGMVVLTEPAHRWDENSQHGKVMNILENNRWCVVSKVRIEKSGVYFIGVYADEQRAVRFSSPARGWLVMKNSIPDEPVAIDGDESLHDSASVHG